MSRINRMQCLGRLWVHIYNVDGNGIWALKQIPTKQIAVNTTSVKDVLFANLAKHLGIVTKRV